MRADLAPLIVCAAYLAAGAGILFALGYMRPTVSGVLAPLGLAFLCGVVAVSLVQTLLLVLGLPGAGLAAFFGVSALIGGAGVVLAWRRRPAPVAGERPPIRRAEWWLAAATMAGAAVYAVVGYRWAVAQPLNAWDAWALWGIKSTLMLQHDTLPTTFFTAPEYVSTHQDYPLLHTLYEATYFRVHGSADVRGMAGQFWILAVAFLWAAAYLGNRLTRPAVWAPLLGVAALTPGVRDQLVTLYADIPMVLFLVTGVLLCGLWLRDRRGTDLALGALLLAGAASTKNEGLTAAAAVLAALLLVALVWDRAHVRPVLFAGIGVLVAIAPWRIWLAAHSIEGDMPIAKGLNPSYLLDRTERVWPSVEELAEQVTASGPWGRLVPWALALLVIAFAVRSTRRIASFYAIAAVLMFCSLVWAYWISPNDLAWHLGTSASRTIDVLTLLSVAVLLHLSGALLRTAPRQLAALVNGSPPEPAGERFERVGAPT